MQWVWQDCYQQPKLSYDIDPAARALCGELAALNGVADRVMIVGAPGPDAFARHAGRRVLLVCDIEGGEVGLLDPAAQPSRWSSTSWSRLTTARGRCQQC